MLESMLGIAFSWQWDYDTNRRERVQGNRIPWTRISKGCTRNDEEIRGMRKEDLFHIGYRMWWHYCNQRRPFFCMWRHYAPISSKKSSRMEGYHILQPIQNICCCLSQSKSNEEKLSRDPSQHTLLQCLVWTVHWWIYPILDGGL